MALRAPSIVWAYAALTAAFLAINALKWPYGEGLRHPTILFERIPAQELGGLVPGGLPQLQQARLKRSLSRMPAVRLGREVGNSLRVAGGQTLDWAIWGGREPLMLFGNVELWVSRGLTSESRAEISRASAAIGAYRRRLESEGWTMVVVPVPTKLGIHRELARWPVQGPGLLSRSEIAEDRSDTVYGFLRERLAAEGVPHVDLQSAYRASLVREPARLPFVPGDSHWSGDGIRLAAAETARVIADVSKVAAREPVAPTFHEFDHVGDIAKAFDPWRGFVSRLRPVWHYRERLLNGEAGRGYPYPDRPTALVAAVGTSYTGQYTWIPQPVGFAGQLGLHLANAEVQSRAAAGKGSFHAFQLFWEGRREIAHAFEAKHGPGHARIVVWEFPVRDIANIGHPARVD